MREIMDYFLEKYLRLIYRRFSGHPSHDPESCPSEMRLRGLTAIVGVIVVCDSGKKSPRSAFLSSSRLLGNASSWYRAPLLVRQQLRDMSNVLSKFRPDHFKIGIHGMLFSPRSNPARLCRFVAVHWTSVIQQQYQGEDMLRRHKSDRVLYTTQQQRRSFFHNPQRTIHSQEMTDVQCTQKRSTGSLMLGPGLHELRRNWKADDLFVTVNTFLSQP